MKATTRTTTPPTRCCVHHPARCDVIYQRGRAAGDELSVPLSVARFLSFLLLHLLAQGERNCNNLVGSHRSSHNNSYMLLLRRCCVAYLVKNATKKTYVKRDELQYVQACINLSKIPGISCAHQVSPSRDRNLPSRKVFLIYIRSPPKSVPDSAIATIPSRRSHPTTRPPPPATDACQAQQKNKTTTSYHPKAPTVTRDNAFPPPHNQAQIITTPHHHEAPITPLLPQLTRISGYPPNYR